MAKYGIQEGLAIRNVKKPSFKFTMDTIEHPDYVELRIYEDEIMEFNETQRFEVMEYLIMCQRVVESFGHKCYPGGVVGKPPRRNLRPIN
jgi:hypothetical protein